MLGMSGVSNFLCVCVCVSVCVQDNLYRRYMQDKKNILNPSASFLVEAFPLNQGGKLFDFEKNCRWIRVGQWGVQTLIRDRRNFFKWLLNS